MQQIHFPNRQGLYDPENEHDACGVGLLVNIRGTKSHQIVEKGLQVLEHMIHRGAEGADPKTGDGAGIMVQIPHEFILLQGVAVPEKGYYGTGLVFLPKQRADQEAILDMIQATVAEEGLSLLTIRDVPVNSDILGIDSRAAEGRQESCARTVTGIRIAGHTWTICPIGASPFPSPSGPGSSAS